MSTNASKSTSKFSIVRKISEFLKLGDEGKLDSFFTRVQKTLEKEISGLKKNLDNLKFNHDQKIDELNDHLEDANSALNDSYLQVDVEKIDTNESQKEFMEVYLSNIDKNLLAVKGIENEITQEKEQYAKLVTETEEQIESLKKRIQKISE